MGPAVAALLALPVVGHGPLEDGAAGGCLEEGPGELDGGGHLLAGELDGEEPLLDDPCPGEPLDAETGVEADVFLSKNSRNSIGAR